jgi:dGTPase
LFARLFEKVERIYPNAAKKLQFNEVLRRMLDRWVGNLIENTQTQVNGINAGSPRQANGGSRAITLDEIRTYPKRLVGLSAEIKAEQRETKEFLYQNLYYSPVLEPEKEDAERIITQLFELWMEHPEKLPASYQEKAESEPRARVVCDYIAGMTDTYIYEQYEKYCGASTSSAAKRR